MSAAPNDSRKRSKKRFVAGHSNSKRWKGSRELEVGMQGILITCNMNQRKCTAEALDLLNEYAEKLYGPEKLPDANGGSSEEEDVDVALKKEVAQLQACNTKQERRFQAIESGANNVIFIKTQNMEPEKLIHQILTDLHTSKKKKSRVILRMLPVSITPFQEDMVKYLTTFLEPWFKTPNCATYKIAFKARNSSHNKRDEIIKSIAGIVGKLNPKNKVDLTNPELTIIVEVIKAVCCISVVKDYTLYRKYNVQEVVKEEEAKPNAAKPITDTTEQEEQAEEVKEEEEVVVVKEQEVEEEEEEESTETEDKNVSQNNEEAENGGK
ncbi:THUMP domain-containing protein 1 [Oryzias melastigma]|uniref:THUMP domain-containing protein 1 n=1 Tax=Oryzias melastigma TaxID=30732 RepID=A0A834FLK9_ORYME|nr:THUMP domain-containing protein 1 [Oryzias melastigma]